mmetsp:Transcript_123890/g.219549  ORF Transcript_123890/g.219549 Transcript_123890/m.219549 type:complete len:83 (-) Transcript_123890:61-309(-)
MLAAGPDGAVEAFGCVLHALLLDRSKEKLLMDRAPAERKRELSPQRLCEQLPLLQMDFYAPLHMRSALLVPEDISVRRQWCA